VCDHHGDPPGDAGQLSRRNLLRSAAALGLITTVAAPVAFPSAAAATSTSRTISGRFSALTAPDWHYLPIEVPAGVNAIEVSYVYDHTTYGLPNNTLGNALDIGIFDASGHDLGNAAGFRGWSGGARSSFRITHGSATPGYLAGPLDPGTWYVALGPYSVAPTTGLTWSVTVTLTFGDPEPAYQPLPPPASVPGRGPGWYRGDMHIHSVHSDGRRTLAQVAADARAAGLDFIASTEHNTSSAGLDWGRWAPDDLLVIPGEEVTTRGGHWLAVGVPAGTWIDWRYRVTDGRFGQFADEVRALGGFVGAAHPFSPFSGTTWTFGYQHVDVIEVWNGPWSVDDQATVAAWHAALVAGRRYPAVGNSDAHTVDNVIGHPQTVVRADDLSATAVVAAVRAGRSWLAESAGVDLSFTVSAGGTVASIGETLPGRLVVDAELAVTGAPGCVAVLYGAIGPLGFAVADDAGTIALRQKVLTALAGFLRVEVRRPEVALPQDITTWAPGGPMVALTNPIWLR
jgi:predicted metal-dependent phosphoesterase TrpH